MKIYKNNFLLLSLLCITSIKEINSMNMVESRNDFLQMEKERERFSEDSEISKTYSSYLDIFMNSSYFRIFSNVKDYIKDNTEEEYLSYENLSKMPYEEQYKIIFSDTYYLEQYTSSYTHIHPTEQYIYQAIEAKYSNEYLRQIIKNYDLSGDRMSPSELFKIIGFSLLVQRRLAYENAKLIIELKKTVKTVSKTKKNEIINEIKANMASQESLNFNALFDFIAY